ncbi:MAG: N-acetylmuramoyl-L-alanine amidase AmiA [Rhodobacteraceae bacterium HLUCCA12]|nr:MAG: N-acetylmuramoyl-L-alanine amidase AmiA [Rhodobacteraceae bacterium HLUCCA12]
MTGKAEMTPIRRRRRPVWPAFLAVLALVWPAAALAQERGGIARITGPAEVRGDADALVLELPLTQPVPHRVHLRDAPMRAIVDFRRVDWTGLQPESLPRPAPLADLRVGRAGGGWSRMVLELSRPMAFDTVAMQTDPDTGSARLRLRLVPVSAEDFASRAEPDTGQRTDQDARPPAPLGQRPTVVVLDPGHGGVDPGAERDGLREADLMLGFARELAEDLRRRDGFEVVLTRNDDHFVSLEARIRVARQAEADVFLSLHADALPEGIASGATLYTLAEDASDAAAAALAERHDRADLLGGGVDLSGADDAVAHVLMDIARTETSPVTDRLAETLLQTIGDAGLTTHSRPRQEAAFSVLKAPDIPSILLEIGFMSSPRDLADLRDPDWRARMTRAIGDGLRDWVADEAQRAALRRH